MLISSPGTLAGVSAPKVGVVVRTEMSTLQDRLSVLFCAVVVFVGIDIEHMPAAVSQLLPLVTGLALFAVLPRRELGGVRLSLLMMVMVGWMSASYFWSVDPADTFFTLRLALPPVVFGFVLGQSLSPHHLLRGMRLAVYPVLVVTIMLLVAVPARRVAPPGDDVVGWRGPMGHKNGLGEFAVLLFICILLSRYHRGTQVALLGVATIILFGSDSRTSLGVVVVLVGVLYFSRRWNSESTVVGRATVVGSMLASATAVTLLFLLASSTVFKTVGRDSDLSGRDTIWGAVWPEITAEPIHGYGLGALWNTVEQPTTRIGLAAGNGTIRYGSSHSSFLELLLQLGAVGLILNSALLVRTVRRSAELGLRSHDPVMLLPFMSCALLVVLSNTEAVFPENLKLLAVLVGITMPGAVWRMR